MDTSGRMPTDELEQLRAAHRELQTLLDNTVEHSDAILAELAEANTRLAQEVQDRKLAEERLQRLLDTFGRQKDDLEIMVQMLTSHGDEMEAQWWRDLCDAQRQMCVDSLTGLANRRRLDDYLAEQWQLHHQRAEPLAVLLCDIDHFKSYNDTHGHPAGDEVLRQVSTVLRDACRDPRDLAARYGGEEFCLVLPETEQPDALTIAQRVQQDLACAAIPHGHPSPESRVTLSIGLMSVIPDAERQQSEFIEQVDKHLYNAKRSGRNQISHGGCA